MSWRPPPGRPSLTRLTSGRREGYMTSIRTSLLAATLAAVLAGAAVPVAVAGLPGRAATSPIVPVAAMTPAYHTYAWPVQGPVIRGFEPPPTPYSSGHRGVDIGAPF